MTNYARGVYCERLAMRDLRADEYEVMRSAGSHGIIDVVAWNEMGVRFIQVKNGDHITRDERAALEALVVPDNASAEIWMRLGSGNNRHWRKEVFSKLSRSWYSL